jgi:hypothetical protein
MKHLLEFDFIPGPFSTAAQVAQYEAYPFKWVAGFPHRNKESHVAASFTSSDTPYNPTPYSIGMAKFSLDCPGLDIQERPEFAIEWFNHQGSPRDRCDSFAK